MQCLYWLFVGLAGFSVGQVACAQVFSDAPEPYRSLIVLMVGANLALMALLARRPLVAMGGFYVLGALGLALANLVSLGGSARLPCALVCVIGGAGLVLSFCDWSLIISSALTGACAMVASAGALVPVLGSGVAALLLVVLATIGIAVQAKLRAAQWLGHFDNVPGNTTA